MKLENFLNPKSIAIIGASNNRKKLGFQILENLKKGGYKGKVFPINLDDKKILNIKAYQSITELNSKVDLAVIVIPAKFVLDEIKKCAVAKVKNIIIISAGFSETGKEGKDLESKIREIGNKNKLNILGPNCLGIINSYQNINTTFAKSDVKKGNVAFVSQSGAVGSAVLDWMQDQEFGLSYFVSLGNKAVMDENNFFEYFRNDKNTDLVIAYLEEIEKGQKFMQAVTKLSKIKPVAILKTGQSDAGKKAAMSHTGSLAGSSEAVRAAFNRSGIISLNSLEEAFGLMKLAQRKTEIKNKDIYIISNAGGPLVMTVDLFGKYNFPIGEFSKDLELELRKRLKEVKLTHNPLDIIGDADALRYEKSISAVLNDSNVNNLLILLTPQTSTEIEKTGKIIVKQAKKHTKKFICASFIGGKSLKGVKQLLAKNNVPCFDYPEQAVEAMTQFISQKIESRNILPYQCNNEKAISVSKISTQLDYLESFKLLKKYNISIAKTTRINSKKDLNKLSYPVVLKVVGPRLIHKTDEDSLALNLNNKEEAGRAFGSFGDMLSKEDNYCIGQSMVKDGFEMILGFKRDKSFGPIIMVGSGGIYAEIFKDISLEVDDIDNKRALEMIKKLNSYKILLGARGKEKLDIYSLAKAIVNIAKLAKENPDIQELDINPLFARKKGIVAADVRIIK